MDHLNDVTIEKRVAGFADAVLASPVRVLNRSLAAAGYEPDGNRVRLCCASLKKIRDNAPKSRESVMYRTLSFLAKLMFVRPDFRGVLLGPEDLAESKVKKDVEPAKEASAVTVDVPDKQSLRLLNSQYKIGEFVVIWGRRYNMIIRPSAVKSFTLEGNKAVMTMPEDSSISQKEEFLLEQLVSILKGKIEILIPKIESATRKHCKTWGIWTLKKAWGDCNPSRSIIRLNFNLVHLPVECLGATILHEVLHFIRKRHNKVFYRLMDHFMPSWRDADKLKRHFVSLYLKPARKNKADKKGVKTLTIKWFDDEPEEWFDDEPEPIAVPEPAATTASQPTVQYGYRLPENDRFGNTFFFNEVGKPVQVINRYGDVYNLMYLGSWNYAVDQCGNQYWLDNAGVIVYYRNVDGAEGYMYA